MLAAEGMAVMADVTTTCSKCGATFETKRGLAVHRTRTHAAGADAAYSTATARAIPCTFPGCAAHFQSRLGLRIHTTLMGHQAPADTLAKGDGPPSRRRVRQTQPVEDSQIMDMGDMGDMG